MPTTTSYLHVAELDPFEMDSVFERLPELNRRNDTQKIVKALSAASNMLPEEPQDPEYALAAIRDMDFLASSILRHGLHPFDYAPMLEQQLLDLSGTTQTVPRGTVFTYAAANPEGARRRLFTGSSEENVFIDSVTSGIQSLDYAMGYIATTNIHNDTELKNALQRADTAMTNLVTSIVTVHRAISPDFFTNHMRPYFEPLTIGGESFTGAGGAQMQLLALDNMLWGCDDQSETYQQFFNENITYLTPMQRDALEMYLGSNGQQSIVDWVCSNDIDPATRHAAKLLLKKIKKFRYPHRRIARDNFAVRDDGAVGSGAYTPAILDILIEKTEAAIGRLEKDGNE